MKIDRFLFICNLNRINVINLMGEIKYILSTEPDLHTFNYSEYIKKRKFV